ncbi:CRISPR-associated protein Cas4 [Infirmifilum lucidum]|uniref:CRISPR-associated exonuclease Cas4 n=1 Tax=Infirmifilum lucidum TaxID=2776706 RepID=A0A7L9FGI1_9CREN|nr:CRISPR-associated protein Cas4 [Infirmifilum lucidum]QOJ78817.1 CRISPR-associated protein Cas4 [Infirmifilum lucidum]
MSLYSLEELDLLPVVLLKEYAYCPRYAYFQFRVGGEYATPSMLVASELGAPDFEVPDGWEAYRSVYVKSRALGLHGFADAVLKRGGLVRVVEAKALTRVTRRSLFGRARHVLVQAVAYALLAEETLKATADAVIVLGSEGRVEVRVTPALRSYVVSLASSMRRSLASPEPPPRVQSWKCGYCYYRRLCRQLMP